MVKQKRKKKIREYQRIPLHYIRVPAFGEVRTTHSIVLGVHCGAQQ